MYDFHSHPSDHGASHELQPLTNNIHLIFGLTTLSYEIIHSLAHIIVKVFLVKLSY